MHHPRYLIVLTHLTQHSDIALLALTIFKCDYISMDSTTDNVFLKTSGTGEGFLLIPNIFGQIKEREN